MSPIDILDTVLNELATNPFLISPDASDGMIGAEVLKKFPDLNHDRFYSDLGRILNKLCKDGYVDRYLRPFTPKENEEQIYYYSISFDGKLFNTNMGYREAKKVSDAKIEEDRNFRVRTEAMAKRLNFLTLFLAIAGFLNAYPLLAEYQERHILNYSYLFYLLLGVLIGWLLTILILKLSKR